MSVKSLKTHVMDGRAALTDQDGAVLLQPQQMLPNSSRTSSAIVDEENKDIKKE